MRSLFADALTSTLLISGGIYYTDKLLYQKTVSDFDFSTSLFFIISKTKA